MIPPAFILVRPQMGENIGAAARAMLNFGLERMRIVAPRDGWPNSAAVALASGAGRVLDQAGLFPDVQAAIADCDFVFATTARGRELTKPIYTPEAAMEYARGLVAAGKRVGVLFGPERAGLENEDVVLANAIVTVPVNPEFASLNLAQCVLLMGYEWRRQTQPAEAVVMEMARTEMASGIEVEKLGDHFEERLEAAGFFFPEAKVPGMKASLRNMWSRLGLTKAEVQTFHGMLRQIAYRLRKQGDE
ncbi:RNA methyltransferase [Cypionkella sp.]|uniref:RNA methyltransferase n=1 Tax=Cypionkella sp. TaxID=2811411 RepID=UPI002ABC69A4|nr:RNA methyltransferase [Cypionkella sp.]MDZ4392182.1 RNA methyltransferase [Cypionkella sp.]